MSEPRSLLLDLMRFLFALLVVVGHGFGFFFDYFDGFFPEVFPYIQSIAVVAFFYLSGFLVVGSQLDRAGSARGGLGPYLFDRATRVYVTLIPSLVFVVAVDMFFLKFTSLELDLVKNYTDIRRLIENLLLVLNMPYGTMRPIWSLMYEWWIYLLFGGLFFLRVRPWPAVVLIATGLYYTFFVNARGEAGHIWILWAVGGACAYAQRHCDLERLSKQVHLAATLLFTTLALVLYWLTKNAFDIQGGVALSLALFFFLYLGDAFSSWLVPGAKLVRGLAGLSFTLFLTHYSVLTYTRAFFGLQGVAGFVVGLTVSCLIAYAIAWCTEYRLSTIKSWLRRAGGRGEPAGPG